MTESAQRPRNTPSPRLESLRRYLVWLFPLLLLILGLALGISSLASTAVVDYSTSFAGTLSAGNVTLILPAPESQYVQMNMTQGGCDLRLYLATPDEWLRFNATGELPGTWIGCTNRSITVTSDVQDLVLVNGGGSPLPYNITVEGYSNALPYGWLAIPGMALALSGLILLVSRVVLAEALRMKEEIDGKENKK